MRIINSLAIDGTVFVTRGNRIIWSWFAPDWLIAVVVYLRKD